MASLRLRSKFYSAQFRLPHDDGSWKQVSLKTKLSDVNAARRFANCAEQMSLQAKASDKTHGMKYCEILLDAIRDAGASRLTEKKAREYLSRIYKVVTGKPLESYSVRDWFAEYLRQKKPNVASSTFTAYEWCYDTFLKFLGDRADAGIEFIEHSDIRAWRDEQKRSGLSDKRVNNLLKYLSGPFAKAAKTGMISINPVAATESLRIGDSMARKPFTLPESVRLLQACPSREWKVVLLFGIYCGMRLGDACHRKKADLDLDANTVTFVPEKKKSAGKEITLPLHPVLVAEIKALLREQKDKATGWLTPGLEATPIGGKTGLSNVFVGIMKSADVARGASVEGTGRGRTRFERSFHSTRHTSATWLANEGVEEDLRMLVTDHESREVAKRYTHHSVELLRNAIGKMPSIVQS